MFTWLLNLFRPYRHEGCETTYLIEPEPEVFLPYDPEDDEEEPSYQHPYIIPVDDLEALTHVYGNCGRKKPDSKWERKNLVLIEGLPGYWNKKSKKNSPGNCRLYCHYKMAPALIEALRRCVLYGVIDEIYKMGCWNWRKKRTNSNLSTHSWAISVDINPKDGRQMQWKRGTAPKPWSDEWYEYWPKGPSKQLVWAFEEAGFRWGGWWQTVPDPTHMQLTK